MICLLRPVGYPRPLSTSFASPYHIVVVTYVNVDIHFTCLSCLIMTLSCLKSPLLCVVYTNLLHLTTNLFDMICCVYSLYVMMCVCHILMKLTYLLKTVLFYADAFGTGKAGSLSLNFCFWFHDEPCCRLFVSSVMLLIVAVNVCVCIVHLVTLSNQSAEVIGYETLLLYYSHRLLMFLWMTVWTYI